MHPLHIDSLSGLSVDSAQFRQRAPRVELSDDPDTATQQTVQEMCRQIHQAATDPLVRQAAWEAVHRFSPESKYFSISIPDACWWWAKHALRFKHHGSMFEAWSADLGDPSTKLQLLIAPDVLLRMSSMEGDCAIYTMMICAMLEALGVQWEIVTAAVDARQPEIFGHVWPRAILPDGNRESLDASHGKYPGWQVPAYDLHRVWIFNANGQKIGEQGARFTGLHAYRASRGFGDIIGYDEDGAPIDDGTGTTYGSIDTSGGYGPPTPNDYYPTTAPVGEYQDSSGRSYSGAVYTAPSQSSSQWASFAAAMGKAGFDLAKLSTIQPGTVLSANGAILRQNPGYAVSGASSVSGLSTSTLMIGGLILLGAVFMFSKK